MSEVTAARVQPEAATVDAPVLLWELEPWRRVFLRNLGDTLLRREPPPVETTAKPVPLRRNYFIKTGIDLIRVTESYSGHILFVLMVYLVCTLPFFNPAPLLHSPVENTEISYVPGQRISAADQHRRQGCDEAAAWRAQAGEAGDPVRSAERGQQSPDHRHAAEDQAGSRCAVAEHRGVDADPVDAAGRGFGAIGFAVEGAAVQPDVVAPTADVSKRTTN